MMELLKHWAPQVYQDTRKDNPFFHQYYEAQDFIVKVDFDGDWYSNNQKRNSEIPNEGFYPQMVGNAYVSYVESKSHYFLQYGFYHTNDDAVLPIDQHENDYEYVMLAILKDGSKFGYLQALATQSHNTYYYYTEENIPYAGQKGKARPMIYISSNGDVLNDCIDFNAKGHGISTYNPLDRCAKDDGVVYNVADRGEAPTSTEGLFKNHYDYGLVYFNELWNRRNLTSNNPFTSTYGKLYAGSAKVPFDVDWLQDPIAAFTKVEEFKFLKESPNFSYEYIFNPYSNNVDINNKNYVSLAGLQTKKIGKQLSGDSNYIKNTFTINATGSIIGNQDNFTFNYTSLKGSDITDYPIESSIEARVYQLQENINPNASTGVMIRESLWEFSKNVMVSYTSRGIVFQYRINDSLQTEQILTTDKINTPVWVKLTRKGNLFKAFYTLDKGSNLKIWNEIGAVVIDMNIKNESYIGLATASGTEEFMVSAVMDQIKINSSTPDDYICSPKKIFIENEQNKNSLELGYSLRAGEYLVSENRKYKLILENDGYLVLYASSDDCESRILWQITDKATEFTLQQDGNLVLKNNNDFIWSSQTKNLIRLLLKDDGNFVLISDDFTEVWKSNTIDTKQPVSIFKDAFCSSKILKDDKPSTKNYLLAEPISFMKTDDYLISENRKFMFIFNQQGLRIYSTSDQCNSKVIWRVENNKNQYLNRFSLQSKGNLILHGTKTNSKILADVVWQSDTSSSGGDSLVLENNGNLVLFAGKKIVWTSKSTNPSDQMAVISLPDAEPDNENENQKLGLSVFVFPNPTQDKIQIYSNQSFSSILVSNSSAQEIKRINTNQGNQLIDMNLSDLPKGLYFISLYNENRVLLVTKKIYLK